MNPAELDRVRSPAQAFSRCTRPLSRELHLRPRRPEPEPRRRVPAAAGDPKRSLLVHARTELSSTAWPTAWYLAVAAAAAVDPLGKPWEQGFRTPTPAGDDR